MPDTRTLAVTNEYDRDLLNLLPHFDVIDQLIDYYFEYCNWIHRYAFGCFCHLFTIRF